MTRTITLKSGLKKKKKVYQKFESDWKTYWSSSLAVQNDVKTYGEAVFKREILRLCRTKAELSYYETKYQLEQDVLIFPELWYNAFVSCRINRDHLKHLFDNP